MQGDDRIRNQRYRWAGVFLVTTLTAMLPPMVAADADLDEELEAALALTPDIEKGRKLFLVCAACHSTEGWGSSDGAFPQIAGQHREVILKQIADIREGNRDAPLMRPFAKKRILGGAQELADVTGYISLLLMNPAVSQGPGKNLKHGRKLYARKCANCHGDLGEGDGEAEIPRIQGQHYSYLLRQLIWIKEGKRRNANRRMARLIKKLKAEDLEALADVISRLLPPADELGPVGWKNPDYN